MFRWLALGVLLLLPRFAQAQQAQTDDQFLDERACVDKDQIAPTVPPVDKKAKKKKTPDKLKPLSLVVCEVEKALDAYQQSPEVTDKTKKDVLPGILSADFDFKTVVDTKGTVGIGFYIFKIGGSYDKQTTNDVDFQYVPKSLVKGPGYAIEKATVSFQDELLKTIKNAAQSIKDEQARPVPISSKDPLVFKQLSVTVSFGVTWDINGGINVPINIVTLTAQLDRSKNAVQSVKLVFGPPPTKEPPAKDDKH
jgi:hypothetical protein